jgi:hypothetical protein
LDDHSEGEEEEEEDAISYKCLQNVDLGCGLAFVEGMELRASPK